MEIPRFIVYNPRQVGHMLKKEKGEVEGGKTKRKRSFECVVNLLAERMAPSRSRTRSRTSLDKAPVPIVLDYQASAILP